MYVLIADVMLVYHVSVALSMSAHVLLLNLIVRSPLKDSKFAWESLRRGGAGQRIGSVDIFKNYRDVIASSDRALNCVGVVVGSVVRENDIWGGGCVVGKVNGKMRAKMLKWSIRYHSGELPASRVGVSVAQVGVVALRSAII